MDSGAIPDGDRSAVPLVGPGDGIGRWLAFIGRNLLDHDNIYIGPATPGVD